jgi:hypothetical protein
MPIDLEKANSNKEMILTTLSAKGPSLPVHLAQAIQLSPLFASAFLSELYSEGKVKISNMKVGSSPLYFLPTQELLLENFIDYLNPREKEALHLLKKEKVLDDELQSPVVRVALRAIKDFAVPLKITQNDKEKLYWKYFSIHDNELRDLIEKPKKKQEKQIPLEQKQTIEEKPSVEERKVEEQIEKDIKKEVNDGLEEQPKVLIEKTKKTKKTAESKFITNLKEYLSAKEIEVLETIEEKKKEFHAKIRIDTLFGKQEYYLVSKDKKKINETDLVFALQKAQEMKMPSLILTPGELDKKAHEYHKGWKNLIKLEKVKF